MSSDLSRLNDLQALKYLVVILQLFHKISKTYVNFPL